METAFLSTTNFIIEKSQVLNENPYTAIALIVAFAIISLSPSKQKDRQVKPANENNKRGLLGQPAILAIGTANPPKCTNASRSKEFLTKFRDNGDITEEQYEWLVNICASCGIEQKYAGFDVDELLRGEGIYGKTLNVSVEERNEYWKKFTKDMSIRASEKAIENWGGDKQKITHVVFHSCTGFKAPGIELDVVDALGLKNVKRRLGINFMGCFGGFTGMAVAKSFCLSHPNAHVLVICGETCSGHITTSQNRSEQVGSAIFADGAAACIIGPGQVGDWALGTNLTKTMGLDTRDLMTWNPSDTCYTMFLSKQIGNKFGKDLLFSLKSNVRTVLGSNVNGAEVEWCVHPGGKALLDGLSKGLGSEKLRHSYRALKSYGNMSSPTIFFVIKNMTDEAMAKGAEASSDAICLGFGPGLTAEYCALHRIY